MNENNAHPRLQDPEWEQIDRPALGGADAGTEKGSTRAVVRIRSWRTKLLDKDNLYRGCKALLDSLRYACLIPGDSESEIDYEARQIKVAHRWEEKTVIELDLP